MIKISSVIEYGSGIHHKLLEHVRKYRKCFLKKTKTNKQKTKVTVTFNEMKNEYRFIGYVRSKVNLRNQRNSRFYGMSCVVCSILYFSTRGLMMPKVRLGVLAGG